MEIAGNSNGASGKAVYLDYNATTPLEDSVVSAITESLTNAWRNPSSSYKEGKLAKAKIQAARKNIAEMVNGQASEVLFVSGGTEGNATVFHSVVENAILVPPKSIEKECSIPHVITTNIEHDSIALTAEALLQKGRITLTYVPVSKSAGCVEVNGIMNAIRPDTRLVTVMLANNETGVVQPIKEIATELKKMNKERKAAGLPHVYFHTDAAQAIGKIAVDTVELEVDYLTIVGHKFYAPRIGALWVKQLGTKDSAPLHPIFFGGGQECGYRAGTENTPMIVGLGEAARLVNENLDMYHCHMKKVRDYLEKQLEEAFPNQIHFNSRFNDTPRLPNTCNFSILGLNLEGYKILKVVKVLQASVGAACHSDKESKPSHILMASGIPEDIAKNALRLSVGRHTSLQDIDDIIMDLKSAVEQLSP